MLNTEWYNNYMWCMEREGSHSREFPNEYGSGISLMDGSGDYLKYYGSCSSGTGCKSRTDPINGAKCDDKNTGDWDAYWHSFSCKV